LGYAAHAGLSPSSAIIGVMEAETKMKEASVGYRRMEVMDNV
jgi:hypothetical protein